MRKKVKKNVLGGILLPVVCVAVLLCFLSGITNVLHAKEGEEKQRLEEVIRQNAVACYAAEGMYPSNLAYLEEHYGVQIDWNRYDVFYEPIAQNLMPDITVVEK